MSADHEPASPYAPPATASRVARSPASAEVASGQLRALGVLHLVLGGLSLAGAGAFGLILVFGFSQEAADGFGDPTGLATLAVFAVLTLASLAGGALCLWSGLHLLRRARMQLCMTLSALLCLHVPLGTALAIATLLSLQRPEIRALFDRTGARP